MIEFLTFTTKPPHANSTNSLPEVGEPPFGQSTFPILSLVDGLPLLITPSSPSSSLTLMTPVPAPDVLHLMPPDSHSLKSVCEHADGREAGDLPFGRQFFAGHFRAGFGFQRGDRRRFESSGEVGFRRWPRVPHVAAFFRFFFFGSRIFARQFDAFRAVVLTDFFGPFFQATAEFGVGRCSACRRDRADGERRKQAKPDDPDAHHYPSPFPLHSRQRPNPASQDEVPGGRPRPRVYTPPGRFQSPVGASPW